MLKLELIGIKSVKIIGWNESVYDIFIESIKNESLVLEEGDIIAITSKVYSMEQKAATKLEDLTPSEEAIKLADKSKLDPRFAQLVLNESKGDIYGSVYRAILAKTDYGLLANAGIDQSNSPEGYALILPKNPDEIARDFRKRIKSQFGITVAVLILDSRTIPLKKGTTGLSIGVAGIEPVADDIGKKDLYGYTMAITTRALADNLSTAINLLMGETNEQIPFGVIRGLNYEPKENVSTASTLMPEKYCIYFAPLMELIEANKKNKVF
ncbi:MAG: coenzyme F420-0:L-glutamate ligase [Candidatus Kariarchaeaceae archaeon]|jgi:coenzyme F420-0:L-glutamate ligase